MAAIVESSAPVSQGTYECADIAGLLKISERQVWRLNDAGRLPGCIRIGRSVRWSAQAIDRWINSGCPEEVTTC
jgi:predicted DNA-binding transcriptional regulator AlpA